MRKRKQRRHSQRGSTMLEALFGMLFLFFVFFSMLQLFQWIGRQMILDYSAFYGAKGLALGYAGENVFKAARVAAMGASGNDVSTGGMRIPLISSDRNRLRYQANRYMRLGDGSGIKYEYWEPEYTSGNAQLTFGYSAYTEQSRFATRIEHAPLLVPALEKVLNVSATAAGKGKAPEPNGEVYMFNYAKRLLDE